MWGRPRPRPSVERSSTYSLDSGPIPQPALFAWYPEFFGLLEMPPLTVATDIEIEVGHC